MTGAKKVKATSAVREEAKVQDDGLITLSSGVVLHLLENLDPITLMNVMQRLEADRPEVPVTFVETLGREEQNPDDPDYLREVSTWENAYALEIIDVLILLGTEVHSVPKDVEKIPKDIEKLDGFKWLDKLRLLKVEVDKSEQGLYLAWVKHVAVKSAEDMTKLMSRVKRLAGVSEADVDEASDTFQD